LRIDVKKETGRWSKRMAGFGRFHKVASELLRAVEIIEIRRVGNARCWLVML
jgi:hypothetical protein